MAPAVAVAVAVTAIIALAVRRGWSQPDVRWILAVAVAGGTVGGIAADGLAIFIGLIAAAAAIDARLEVIPNELAAATTVAAFYLWVRDGDGWGLLIAGILLVMCAGLFFLGGFGAGDVKFLPPALLGVLSQAPMPMLTLVWSQVFLVLLCVGMVVSHVVAGLSGMRSREQAMAPAILVAAIGTAPIGGHALLVF